jgi:hypothetical protein
MSDRSRIRLAAHKQFQSLQQSWQRFLRLVQGHTPNASLLTQALIQSRHGLQGNSIGVFFVASNAKHKEKKSFGYIQ